MRKEGNGNQKALKEVIPPQILNEIPTFKLEAVTWLVYDISFTNACP